MKRSLDIFGAVVGLLIISPLLVVAALLIWLDDHTSPIYRARRIGKDGVPFTMFKLRSMVPDAEKTGVNSTSADDPRVTRAGRIVRACKFDELPQLWNVLLGQMSFVGPRPQVPAEVAQYTLVEYRMLSIRPGITDLASIVFADEAEILRGSEDSNLEYNRRIRPWKSRLALLYVDNQSLIADLCIVFLTLARPFSRMLSLRGVAWLLKHWGAEQLVVRMASRREPLMPYPAPGLPT